MEITFKRQPDFNYGNGDVTKVWHVENYGETAKNELNEPLKISCYSADDWCHNYQERYFDTQYPTFAQAKSAVIAQLKANTK